MFEGAHEYEDEDECLDQMCQFCETTPGFLVGFARGWVCNECVARYDLYSNPLLFTFKQIGNGYYNDSEYNENYDDYYGGWVVQKPIKVPVIIEEIACDSKNLASHGLVLRPTIVPPSELKLSGRRWQVEIKYF